MSPRFFFLPRSLGKGAGDTGGEGFEMILSPRLLQSVLLACNVHLQDRLFAQKHDPRTGQANQYGGHFNSRDADLWVRLLVGVLYEDKRGALHNGGASSHKGHVDILYLAFPRTSRRLQCTLDDMPEAVQPSCAQAPSEGV